MRLICARWYGQFYPCVVARHTSSIVDRLRPWDALSVRLPSFLAFGPLHVCASCGDTQIVLHFENSSFAAAEEVDNLTSTSSLAVAHDSSAEEMKDALMSLAENALDSFIGELDVSRENNGAQGLQAYRYGSSRASARTDVGCCDEVNCGVDKGMVQKCGTRDDTRIAIVEDRNGEERKLIHIARPHSTAAVDL